MALRTQGTWQYGDSQADIRDELIRYGRLNKYAPSQFASPKCKCGSAVFRLFIDEAQGAAVRCCARCKQDHAMGDSEQYLEAAELHEAACACGASEFEITVGVSLYDDSNDVRWLYVGCRCQACGLTACYGDWKNEFIDYRKLLERI